MWHGLTGLLHSVVKLAIAMWGQVRTTYQSPGAGCIVPGDSQLFHGIVALSQQVIHVIYLRCKIERIIAQLDNMIVVMQQACSLWV